MFAGIEVVRRNLKEIKDENDEDTLVADFEIIFPSLLSEAQCLNLGLLYNLLQIKRKERLGK